jgi:hypothetical protein
LFPTASKVKGATLIWSFAFTARLISGGAVPVAATDCRLAHCSLVAYRGTRLLGRDVDVIVTRGQLFGWKGMPGWPALAGSGVATSRFTTMGSRPLRTTTASQISSRLALIS